MDIDKFKSIISNTTRISGKDAFFFLDVLKQKYYIYAKKYGEEVFNYERCLERYKNAIKIKINLKDFFIAEAEALFIYVKKIEQQSEQKKSKESVSEKIFKKYEESLSKSYNKIAIHKLAAPEIEYVLWAINSFKKNHLNNILLVNKFIKDKYISGIVYNIETQLLELTEKKKSKLPVLFDSYLMKIIREGESNEVVERAGVEIFKAILTVMRNIKRLIISLKNYKDIPKVSVNYSNGTISFNDYFLSILLEDSNQILEDFRLTNI